MQGSHIQNQVASFETLVGRKVDATRHYQNWPDTVVDDDVLASVAAGKSPLIVWHPFYAAGSNIPAKRWSDIAAGLYDADIMRVGAELKTLGTHPARFVFHHECEDDVDEIHKQGACGTGPAEFVGAWRRVKNHLRASGVPKTVQIGVCLMGATYRGGHGGPDPWIPSTMSPDFIATDGYSRDASSLQKPKTFIGTFGDAYNWITARGKPFVIEECGTAELDTDPMFKAQWFNDAATLIPQWKPSLFMYSNVLAANFGGQDYRIDTSPQSLAAFKGLVAKL